MRLVFIGTPWFAVPSLELLAAHGFEIVAVYTQPDRPAGRGRSLTSPPVKVAAEALGLPVRQPPALRGPEVVEELRALRAEVFVAVAYGQLIRREVLAIPPKGVLNVHPSLLPRWRGASPVAASILAGDEETGVSIMLMDEGLDSGPILAQRRCRISPDDTTGTLTKSLAQVGADLLVETLPAWLAGRVTPQPQDERFVTTTGRIKKEDGRIRWDRPAVEIWRAVRAYNPWPSAHTSLNGEMIRIWRAWPIGGDSGLPPGTITGCPALPQDAAGVGAFAVQTGDGLLAILEIQREGRRSLGSEEFLRGVPGLVGMRFDPT